jgi:hypothetical protein
MHFWRKMFYTVHFWRFFRVGWVLFIYRIVKLNIFLGSLLWTEDHMELNESVECWMILEKNEPCEMRWCWSLSSCCFLIVFNTSLVFLYLSYWTFLWLLVSFQRLLITSFGDDFRAFRKTVWHWRNLVEGRMIFNPNLLWGSRTLLRVAEIGSSSHFRIYLDAILFSLSLTQVLPMSETVKCQEILEST